jgi:hypothetical protein
VRQVRLVLAATLVIGVLGACSDDSDDGDEVGALSESEFQDQANDLCKDAAEKDPIDLDKLIREVDALVPPESMQDDVSKMLTEFDDYQKAVDKGETPSTQTVRDADQLADELGLSDCAEVLDA